MSRASGAGAVDIGIGNSNHDQSAQYQKLGFRVTSIVAGFFDDYPEPIVENGIACRDVVRFRVEI